MAANTEGLTVADLVVNEIEKPVPSIGVKVTVVGCGRIGMTVAYGLLDMRLVNEIMLIDCNPEKVKGELLDLQLGTSFTRNVRIACSTDYNITVNSRLVIITAGAKAKLDELPMDWLQRNVDIYKVIIPSVAKFSPNANLLIISSPVDVMTFVAWKFSGFPKNRVIGSGNNLESSRFRYLLSERFGISQFAVHGWIIGGNGDTCVPVWSSVTVSGVQIRSLAPEVGTPKDKENWNELIKTVNNNMADINRFKGRTTWGIAASVTSIARSIVENRREIFCISCAIQDYHGIKQNVFISLPCVLGENGVTHIINQNLTPDEVSLLQFSANSIFDVQTKLKI